jgi:methionyl-tRNA synthetase
VGPDPIDLATFQRLELRTGRILSAAPHPNADRLLVLSVDVGGDTPRTVVAGIAAHYPDPQTMVGRTIVVVVNLVPATLRGVRSDGMLLAAGGKNHRGLVTVLEDCPPGEPVR